jgi:CHAT domain-containing protein/tetratricopeptide (TPR) repeat protein
LTRPDDVHLSAEELRNLLDTEEIGSGILATEPSGDVEATRRHLASCPSCSARLQEYQTVERQLRRLRSPTHASPASACPPENKWMLLGAGLQPSAEAEELLLHATACDYCGPLLRQILQEFDPQTNPDEDRALSALKTHDEQWQKVLATRLATHNQQGDRIRPGATPVSTLKSLLLFPRWAFAVALLLLVGSSGWWFLSSRQSQSADRLLAEAYAQQRTLAMRIPSAQFGQLRVERGSDRSRLTRPSALLEAEAIIAREISRHPDSAVWLQAKGRADLMDGNYAAAIESLQRAADIQPDSSSVSIDLASAYFQRGETESRNADFGKAVELLGKVLLRQPDDQVALFNRAIAFERMSFFSQAIEDWEHYLRLDSKGDWSNEARDRLIDLQKKLQNRQSKLGPLLAPAEVTVLASENEVLATDTINERIEEYQQRAIEEWLSSAFPLDAQSNGSGHNMLRSALRFVAKVSRVKHGDDWLRDLLEGSSDTHFQAAVRALRDATIASQNSQYDVALVEAAKAERLFQQFKSKAGVFRALYEQVFALQFSEDAPACIEFATKAKNRLANDTQHHYPWIRLQFEIEEGICQNLAGDFGAADKALSAASKDAELHDYRLAYLRALTMSALVHWSEGGEEAAWQMLATGIDRCSSQGCPPMRTYSFYANMDNFAEDSGQWFLQVAAAREAVQTLANDQDHLMRALEHHRLAKAAALAGQHSTADENFLIARNLLASVSPSEVTRNYETEIDINLAKLAAEQGNPGVAMQYLLAVKPRLPKTADRYLQVDFYETLAGLQMRSGNLGEAEESLHWAAAIAEHQSCSLRSTRDRLLWRKRSAATFRRLVEIGLRRNTPAAALDLWEWYLAAAPCTRSEGEAQNGLMFERTSNRAPPLSVPRQVSSVLPSLRDVTVVSYALLSDQIGIWVYDDRGVFGLKSPGSSADLVRLGNQFSRLCATPTSNVPALQAVARQLYELLIAPIAGHLDPDRTLVVEGDDAITGLPIQAFLNPAGQYLAERYVLAYSPGLYIWTGLHPRFNSFVGKHALVVGVSSEGTPSLHGLALLPDVRKETESVAKTFRSATVLEGKAATLPNVEREIGKAVVFHYAGHGLVTRQKVGLLLAPVNPGDASVFFDASSLRPALLKNTQLAVLSACATGGEGIGEGLSQPDSLARAFLDAAVPHVVASRWDVDSAATLHLMRNFYAFLQQGMPVAKALNNAEQQVRSSQRTDHPYYWAAFSAFGKS